MLNGAYNNGFIAGQNDIIENRILKVLDYPVIENNSDDIVIGPNDYNVDIEEENNNNNSENSNENDTDDVMVEEGEGGDLPNYQYLAVEKVKLSVRVTDPDVDPNDVIVDYDTVCRNYGNTMTLDVINNPVTVLPGYKILPSQENPNGVRYYSMRNVKFNLKDYGFEITASDLKYDSSSPGHFRIIVPNSNDINNQGVNYLGFQRLTYYLTGLKDASKVESNKIFPIQKSENEIVTVGGIIPYTYNGESFEIIPDIIPDTDPVEEYESMEKVTTRLRLVDVDLPFKDISNNVIVTNYNGYQYLCNEYPNETDGIGRIIPFSGLHGIRFSLKRMDLTYANLPNNFLLELNGSEKAGFDYNGVDNQDNPIVIKVPPVLGFMDGIRVHINNENYFVINDRSYQNNDVVTIKRKAVVDNRGEIIPIVANRSKRLRGLEVDPYIGEEGVTYYDNVNKLYINHHKYTIEEENNYRFNMDESTTEDDNIGFRSVLQTTQIPVMDMVRLPDVESNGIYKYSIDTFNKAYSLDPNSVNTYRDDFVGFDTIEIPIKVNNKTVPLIATVNGLYRPSDIDRDAIGFSSVQIAVSGSGVSNVNNLSGYVFNSNSSLDSNNELVPFSISEYNSSQDPPTNYTGFDNIIINVPAGVDNADVNENNIITSRTGTFNIPSGKTGWNSFSVNVPSDVNNYDPYPSSLPLQISSNGNGSITFDVNTYTGLSNIYYNVTVLPNLYSGYVNNPYQITSTSGTINVPQGSDGLSSVSYNVNIPGYGQVNNYNPYPSSSPLVIDRTGSGSITFDSSSYSGLDTIHYNCTLTGNTNWLLYSSYIYSSNPSILTFDNFVGPFKNNSSETYEIPMEAKVANKYNYLLIHILQRSTGSDKKFVYYGVVGLRYDSFSGEKVTFSTSFNSGYYCWFGFSFYHHSSSIRENSYSSRYMVSTMNDESYIYPSIVYTSSISDSFGADGIIKYNGNALVNSNNSTFTGSYLRGDYLYRIPVSYFVPLPGDDIQRPVVSNYNVNNYTGYNINNRYVISNGGVGELDIPSGYTGLGKIYYDVQVSSGTTIDNADVNANNIITTNGTYDIPTGKTGFNGFSVSVPTVDNADVNSQNNNVIITNGAYTIPSGKTGFNSFSVSVPTVDNADIDSQNNNVITMNGSYNVPSGKTGWNSFTVSVPQPYNNYQYGEQLVTSGNYVVLFSDYYGLRMESFDIPEGYTGLSSFYCEIVPKIYRMVGCFVYDGNPTQSLSVSDFNVQLKEYSNEIYYKFNIPSNSVMIVLQCQYRERLNIMYNSSFSLISSADVYINCTDSVQETEQYYVSSTDGVNGYYLLYGIINISEDVINQSRKRKIVLGLYSDGSGVSCFNVTVKTNPGVLNYIHFYNYPGSEQDLIWISMKVPN